MSHNRNEKMANKELEELTAQALMKLHEHVYDIESLNQWKKQMFDLIDQLGEQKLSSSVPNTQHNSSLDPIDWSSARFVAHQMLNSSMNYIQHVRDRPVWQSVPNNVRAAIENEKLPEQGQSLSAVCHNISNYVIPYGRGSVHPRFWGWVSGEGTLIGVLADMIGATINMNACAYTNSAAFIERTVIEWMFEIFGFPKDRSGGLLVSGTSIGTVISMAAARQRALANVREDGLVNSPQLIVYASTEVHMCVKKALELLGLGSKSLHFIPVDENFQMKTHHLKEAIQDDRENGFVPFCIVGNAGTVNTGAFDNLQEISSIARAENLWFHVDGAFGSCVILDVQRRQLVAGIDRADSLAFDFHKWMHCPYDAGCVLIRDYTYLESTFSMTPSYLSQPDQTYQGNKHWFFNWGLEVSRSFRALKVWATLKEHGIMKLGQKIADNCEQAQYLLSLLEKHKHIIRIIHPISLNIVNFRFEPVEFDKADEELHEMFNKQILEDIQTSGIAFPSSTLIEKRFYIRVCIVSHRSTYKDFDIFMQTLLNLYQTRIQTFLIERK